MKDKQTAKVFITTGNGAISEYPSLSQEELDGVMAALKKLGNYNMDLTIDGRRIPGFKVDQNVVRNQKSGLEEICITFVLLEG